MKRLLTLSLLLLSALAFGATTTPVQLLNPAGSTAGQAILSTGPTSAPAWGTVTLSGVSGTLSIANGGTGATTQAAALTNLLGSSTVPIANGGTGSSSANAARTALGLGTAATVNTGTSGATIPLLNGANTWAAAQTFSVRPTFNGATPYDSANLAIANYAPLASPTFTGTVTIPTGASITKPNIVGTATNDNASAGSVGEYVTANNTATSLTTATAANCTSVSLTAGDWDVQAVVFYTPGSGTSITSLYSGVSTTSATMGALGSYSKQGAAGQVPNNSSVITSPVVRVSIASTTTVYAIGRGDFTVSTLTCDGFIRARRVR